MPSGKTHDLITALVAPPTLLAVGWLTNDWLLASVAMAATLFGGLMFGPDLDIHSKQYTRWGPFRFLWLPYQLAFRHRSRWSHGIVFGTLIRIIYFAGILTLVACLAVYLRATLVAGTAPDYGAVLRTWQLIGEGFVFYGFDRRDLWATLGGLWWGAASHTFTDVFWSIVRKSSEIF